MKWEKGWWNRYGDRISVVFGKLQLRNVGSWNPFWQTAAFAPNNCILERRALEGLKSYGCMPLNGVGFTVLFSKNGDGVFDFFSQKGKQFHSFHLVAKVIALFRYKTYFGEHLKYLTDPIPCCYFWCSEYIEYLKCLCLLYVTERRRKLILLCRSKSKSLHP